MYFPTIPSFLFAVVGLLGTWGLPAMLDDEIKWRGPSAGAKWMGPLKNHLRDGGLAEFRDSLGSTALVGSSSKSTFPRTGVDGVALTVSLRRPAPSSNPNPFEKAITTYSIVFLTRLGVDHEYLPTAYQFRLWPAGLVESLEPPPSHLVAENMGGYLPPRMETGSRRLPTRPCPFSI